MLLTRLSLFQFSFLTTGFAGGTSESIDMNERSVIDIAMPQEHLTKKILRDAARTLFAEQGYNGVSMREIAQKIGKQPGGIYNHFPNKQSILLDLMLENLSRAHDAVIAPIKSDEPADEQLEGFVRRHLRHNIDNPDDIFIAYMELRSLETENSAVITAKRDAYEGALRDILKRGATSGVFTISDPAIHARAILSMLGGVTIWFREGGEQSSDDVAETYIQAVLQSAGVTYNPQSER